MNALVVPTQPFAPLKPDFAFLSDRDMRPVISDYNKPQRHDWRVNHLPLIVGQANPAFLAKTDSVMDEMRQKGVEYVKDATTKRDLSFVPKLFGHAVIHQLDAKNIPPLLPLAEVCETIVQKTLEKDRRWFGHIPSSRYQVSFEYGEMSAQKGRHMDLESETGIPHRDGLFEPIDIGDRSYLFRSRFMTQCFANALTENIGNGHHEVQNAVAGAEPIPARDGALVLINHGNRGTVHNTYVPKPEDGSHPSLFLRVSVFNYG